MSTSREHDGEGNLARVLELAQTSRSEEPSDVVHKVIDQCLISMVFQPIVEMKTGKIFAYEALCRSRVPQFDNPPALIEAATAVGRVGELGRLQRALASRNCPDWPIFVNISPNEFDDGYLVRPDDAMFRHRKQVYVEITESVPLVFFEQCHSVLAELRQKGARLAIDDLGAGYSNLKYIADLAPDIVKLDRELVAGCGLDGHQYELLHSISQLCAQVNAKVVAEGVENPEELEAVSSAGIDYCQGFFLGRPKISPSELSWPASELVVSADFQVRRAARVAEQCEASAEDTERRLEELEEVRSILEKSVRKAKGEVVRLRKAVSNAESNSERAEARLAELESSLVESETNRKRMARLFEAAAMKTKAEENPPKPPKQGVSFKRVAGQGLIWAAGLAAGLMLYKFDPRTSELMPQDEPLSDVVVAEAAVTPSVEPPVPVDASPASTPPVEVVASPPLEIAEVVVPAPPPPPDEGVRALIEEWAGAWSAQDVERYTALYTGDFVAENGLSGDKWRDQRRNRLSRPSFIDVQVSDLEIALEDDAFASAQFVQTYTSDNYSDQVRKRIELVRQAGDWRIARELALE